MKSIIFSFLLLSTTLCLFPYVAFSSTFTSTNNPIVLPTTTTDDNDDVLPEVLDLDGKPLLTGQEYIIEARGGVYLANVDNTTCLNGVVQHPYDLKIGMPLKFFTMDSGNYVVREMDDINIMFSSVPSTNLSCVNETVWKVGDTRFVVTGGTLGNPGPETLNSWFKIENLTKGSSYYKLRYCPSQSMCPTCHIDCSDVGLKPHNGLLQLALTNPRIPYGFKKVHK